jgi:cysteine desulfurase
MRVPLEYAMGTVRLSVGRYTTQEEIDRALEEIKQVVGQHFQAAAAGDW